MSKFQVGQRVVYDGCGRWRVQYIYGGIYGLRNIDNPKESVRAWADRTDLLEPFTGLDVEFIQRGSCVFVYCHSGAGLLIDYEEGSGFIMPFFEEYGFYLENYTGFCFCDGPNGGTEQQATEWIEKAEAAVDEFNASLTATKDVVEPETQEKFEEKCGRCNGTGDERWLGQNPYADEEETGCSDCGGRGTVAVPTKPKNTLKDCVDRARKAWRGQYPEDCKENWNPKVGDWVEAIGEGDGFSKGDKHRVKDVKGGGIFFDDGYIGRIDQFKPCDTPSQKEQETRQEIPGSSSEETSWTPKVGDWVEFTEITKAFKVGEQHKIDTIDSEGMILAGGYWHFPRLLKPCDPPQWTPKVGDWVEATSTGDAFTIGGQHKITGIEDIRPFHFTFEGGLLGLIGRFKPCDPPQEKYTFDVERARGLREMLQEEIDGGHYPTTYHIIMMLLEAEIARHEGGE